MDLQIAALCDSASDYHGKLCILGAFDTIVGAGLPVIHPHCTVAVRVAFRKEEEGLYNFRLNIVDEDGGPIIPPIGGRLDVRLPDGLYFVSTNLVLNLQGLQFPKAGLYSIDIALENRQIASIPLQIRLAQRPPGQ